jgi:hypothetical protein
MLLGKLGGNNRQYLIDDMKLQYQQLNQLQLLNGKSFIPSLISLISLYEL